MKEFFEVFNIKPTEEKYCLWECKKPELENIVCGDTKCEHYRHKVTYPTITPEIVLKLQAIIQKYDVFLKIPRGTSIFKWTLKRCIELEQFAKIGNEVRGLFND